MKLFPRQGRPKQNWCYAHKRRKTTAHPCPSCAKHSARLREDFASGRRKWKQPAHWRGWLPEEEKILREMAGHYSATQIADAIERECGTGRGESAVLNKASRAGISVACREMQTDDVARVLGMSLSAVQKYIQRGFLVADTWLGYKNVRHDVPINRKRFIRRDALADFIKLYPWLVSPGLITDAYFRQVAEVYPNPYIPAKRAAMLYGLSVATVQKYIRRGMVPGGTLPGLGASFHIHRDNLHCVPEEKARAEEANETNRQKFHFSQSRRPKVAA